jgi:hypothetical protein
MTMRRDDVTASSDFTVFSAIFDKLIEVHHEKYDGILLVVSGDAYWKLECMGILYSSQNATA